MASRRPLFYVDGNSTSNVNYDVDGNFTLDCIANCVGVCIYGICFPPPPPSPALLPNNSDAGDSATPIHLHRRDHLVPTLIITIVSAVAVCFAILTIYAFFRFRRRSRRHQHPPVTAATVGDAINGEESGRDLPPGGEIEHHIWYIRTPGLDDSTIASITSWVYKSSDGLIDCRDCSVCLGEFHDGELVRLLPKCSHCFHLHCIDKWLRSHVNCPLCRSAIVSPVNVSVPATSSLSTLISLPVEPEIGSFVPREIPEIEDLPEENGSHGIDMGIVIYPSEGSSSRPSTELPVNSLEEGDELQPIRRSISMDSLSLHAHSRVERAEEELQEEERGDPANNKKSRGFFLKGNLLRKFPHNMERSLSSQSARWFFSRYGRPRNTVLPV